MLAPVYNKGIRHVCGYSANTVLCDNIGHNVTKAKIFDSDTTGNIFGDYPLDALFKCVYLMESENVFDI